MFCNKYLEEFKIDPAKQYFNDRPNKDICNDCKIAKSTLLGLDMQVRAHGPERLGGNWPKISTILEI